MEQLSFFDLPELQGNKEHAAAALKPTRRRAEERDFSQWALVYLVTMSGGNVGNLFVLKTEDAMKLCEDECSHGSARGGRWMFQWTALDHFRRDDAAAAQHKNVFGKLEPFVFIRDSGRQDADFKRLGIIKPSISECKKLLSDMGYELIYKTGR